jgi:tryptophan-rich sensory protein
VNVVANLLFTPMFVSFGLLAGLITILVVLTTAVWLQMKTWSSAPLVFALLLPYTVGVSFALVLQASLVLLN